MKYLATTLAILLMVPVAASAFPYNWDFSATAGDAVGSATMDLEYVPASTYTYTATVNNTSPTTTGGGATNSPGIVGFGFFLDQDNNKNDPTPPPGVVSWSLSGFTSNASGTTATTIGSSTVGGLPWILDYNQDNTVGFKYIDYYSNSGGGVSYALYNPLASTGFGDDPYFTEAVLTLTLSSALVFDTDGGGFVRMQNVGRNGAFSLKIFNDDSGIPPQVVIPEPSTFVLLFAGLIGLVTVYRRKKD